MPKRDWITKDLTWKLFSLILAVGLWITIHNLRDTPEVAVDPFATVRAVTFTNLPVLAVSANADVHSAQVVPNVVTVKLSGSSDAIADLQSNKVHAIVNLTGIDTASGSRMPVDVSAPPGVALDTVDPPKVSVTISPPTE
ncbi:MAG TPA: CdaR family protein [Candidatus Sulfopaludibacter sp.]|nr:CdaR family protein [Candidatus Sulfopaludibacter sp.]